MNSKPNKLLQHIAINKGKVMSQLRIHSTINALPPLTPIILSYRDCLQYWQKTLNEGFNYSIALVDQLISMLKSQTDRIEQPTILKLTRTTSSGQNRNNIQEFVNKIQSNKKQLRTIFIKSITSINNFPLYQITNEPIAITYDGNLKWLLTYNLKTKTKTKTVMSNLRMPQLRNIGKSIYITGGAIDSSKCYKFNLLNSEIAELSNMKYARCYHSLENIVNKFIYCVGGFNGDYMTNCEQYSIKDDKWEDMPSIAHKRDRGVLCQINNKYLYYFGGQSTTADRVNIIERFNLFKMQRWKLITVQDNIHWCGTEGSGAMLIADGQMILFGGINKFIQKDKFCFTIACCKEGVSRVEFDSSLCTEDTFSSPCTVYDGCAYAISDTLCIHAYSIKEKKWSLIAKEEWI